MNPTDPSELSPAAEAFAAYLVRFEDDPAADFDAFCAEHPELEGDLRRLHTRWRSLGPGLVGRIGPIGRDGETAELGAAGALLDELRGDPGVPRYEILGEIGRGGSGVILRVWDRSLRRHLAMKVLHGQREGGDPRAVDARMLSRFVGEAQITGQLDHPGILPVHEVGLDADGRVYFTMPLVRGRNLQEIARLVKRGEEGWSLLRAVGVVLRVCEAVGYAHSKGVIHRDLKPANVMVGALGETYVMDWGYARILSEGGKDAERASTPPLVRTVRTETTLDSPLLTMHGDVIGTPVYMSPEQAQGKVDEIGRASDVYSIGAMLYQLATGYGPYLSPGEASSAEDVLSAARARPPRPIHALAPDVPEELEAICAKAMERDPRARYADTLEMAADLRAFLEQRVVAAYEAGPLAELRKWVKRNRVLAGTGAAAVVFLAAGFATSSTLFFRSRRNEDAAKHSELAAKAAKVEVEETAARLSDELRASRIERGRLLGRTGDFLAAEDLLWRAFLVAPDSPQAHWALWELYRKNPCWTALVAHTGAVGAVAHSPDGALFASGGDDGVIRLWEAGSYRAVAEFAPLADPVTALAFDPASDLLAAGLESGAIVLCNVRARTVVRVLEGHADRVWSLAFDPTGERLASGARSEPVRVWDLRSNACTVVAPPDGRIALSVRVAFGPDGRLAVAGVGNRVHVWDDTGHAPVLSLAGGAAPGSVAFDAAGARIAAGGWRSWIRVWDARTGATLADLDASNGTIRDVCFDPARDRLYSGGWWRIDAWSVSAQARLSSIHVNQLVYDIDLSPDGRFLAVALEVAGPLRIWETAPEGDFTRLPGHTGYAVAAFAPDAHLVATGAEGGAIRLFRDGAPQPEAVLPGPGAGIPGQAATIQALDATPDGRVLASGGSDGMLRLWDVGTRTLLHEFAGYNDLSDYCLDVGPHGRVIAYGADRTKLVIRDVASGALRSTCELPGRVQTVAIDPAGETVCAVAESHAYLVSLDGELLGEVPIPGERLWSIAFSPDGKLLAIGSWDRNVHVLDRATLQPVARLAGHGGTVWGLAFHPRDPRLLASSSADGSIRLWDVPSARCVATIDAFGGAEVSKIEFTPDGRRLIAAGQSSDVLLIDLSYFERHIAGNLRHQLERLGPELGRDAQAERLTAWADGVLAARSVPGAGPGEQAGDAR